MMAVQYLKPPKQIALFCGSKLYQLNMGKKSAALDCYWQVVNVLILKNTAITRPCLWHDDLHDDNVFVDLYNSARIMCIIDWQSCHISPLFNHNINPAFLDWDSLELETLDLASWLNISGLSLKECCVAVYEYTIQNVFIGWWKLMQVKNPELYWMVNFRKTAVYELIFLAHWMFKYSEAHFQSLLTDLKRTWAELSAIMSDIPFLFNFLEADYECIKVDCDGTVAGTEFVAEAKKKLSNLWFDKGFIKYKWYCDCKIALDRVKDLILKQLAKTDDKRAEYEHY